MLGKGNKAGSLNDSRVNSRIFYGWVVAIAGAVALFATGSFVYTFGVFIKPLTDSFGWSRTSISGCVSVRSIISIIYAPVVGAWSDRYGPRKFILVGVLLIGLSYLLASRITSLWQMYLFLGVLIALGMPSTFISVGATAARWFGRRSALANGIVMSGFSMALIVLPPVATFLILRYSWQTCFIILGLIVWVIGIIAWRFIKSPPPGIEYDTLAKSWEGGNAVTGSQIAAGVDHGYTFSEMLRNSTFQVMLVVNTIVALSYQMVVVHVVPAAIQTGITAEAAAIILTLSGIGNTVGRLALGALAGKLGNKIVLILCLALQAVVLFSLADARDLYVFYVSTTVYGLAYGGVTPLIVAMAGSFFGTRAMGSIFGAISMTLNAGTAIGPLLAGYIWDTTGSYHIAFSMAGIAMVILFLLSLLLKPPVKREVAT